MYKWQIVDDAVRSLEEHETIYPRLKRKVEDMKNETYGVRLVDEISLLVNDVKTRALIIYNVFSAMVIKTYPIWSQSYMSERNIDEIKTILNTPISVLLRKFDISVSSALRSAGPAHELFRAFRDLLLTGLGNDRIEDVMSGIRQVLIRYV